MSVIVSVVLVLVGLAIYWYGLVRPRGVVPGWGWGEEEPRPSVAGMVVWLGIPLVLWVLAAMAPWQDGGTPTWRYLLTIAAVWLGIEIIRRIHNQRHSATAAA